MDKEQARFVLSSFRPDGADAGDADFAAALHLAAEDRELGEWLARERAMDADFARVLAGAPIPEALRESILLGLHVETHGIPAVEDPADMLMVGALAAVVPPETLRSEILAAMRVSTPQSSAKPAKPLWQRPWFMPTAAAAVVAFGTWLAFESPVSGPPARGTTAATPARTISPASITRVSISALETPDAHPELQSVAHVDAWLEGRKLPAPVALPAGLKQRHCVGGRPIDVGGRRGSMLCYDSDAGPVHLVVFDRPCVSGPLPLVPEVTEEAGWTVAKWCDGERAYVLLSKAPAEHVDRLF